MAGDRQHSLGQQIVAQRGITHGRGSRAHGNWAGVRGTRDWDGPVMPDSEKGRRGVQNGRRGVQGGRGHAHGATKVHNRRPGRSTTATGANCPMKQAHCRVRAWEKPTAPDTGEWGRHVGRGKFVSVGERGRHKGRPGGSGKGRPGGSGKQATVPNILVQICDVQKFKLAKQNEPDNDNLSTTRVRPSSKGTAHQSPLKLRFGRQRVDLHMSLWWSLMVRNGPRRLDEPRHVRQHVDGANRVTGCCEISPISMEYWICNMN